MSSPFPEDAPCGGCGHFSCPYCNPRDSSHNSWSIESHLGALNDRAHEEEKVARPAKSNRAKEVEETMPSGDHYFWGYVHRIGF